MIGTAQRKAYRVWMVIDCDSYLERCSALVRDIRKGERRVSFDRSDSNRGVQSNAYKRLRTNANTLIVLALLVTTLLPNYISTLHLASYSTRSDLRH